MTGKCHKLYANSPLILVVPFGATNPRTGGGQRTKLLFDGLKQMGDVIVVYLSQENDRNNGISEFFQGAQRVITIKTDGISRPKNALKRLLFGASKVLLPTQMYKEDVNLKSELINLLLESKAAMICFRYTLSLAKAGVVTDRKFSAPIVLDIDDRDDLKTQAQLKKTFSPVATKAVVDVLTRDLRRMLHTLWNNADHIFLAKESDFLDTHSPGSQSVIPNTPQSSPSYSEIVPVSETKRTILFIGSAGHTMNVDGVLWFLNRCWEQILSSVPDAEIRIVGLGNWSPVKKLYGHLPSVKIVGKVDSVLTEYNKARLAICPIWVGAGSQIKIIEACAYARPVVSTNISAAGFGEKIGERIYCCKDTKSFIQGCIKYLVDPVSAARDGAALRQLQKEFYSRETALGLIRSALSNKISI